MRFDPVWYDCDESGSASDDSSTLPFELPYQNSSSSLRACLFGDGWRDPESWLTLLEYKVESSAASTGGGPMRWLDAVGPSAGTLPLANRSLTLSLSGQSALLHGTWYRIGFRARNAADLYSNFSFTARRDPLPCAATP